MTDYFVDQRAGGLNNGAADAAPAGTLNPAIIANAWQSLADISGLVVGDTVTIVRGSGFYDEVLDLQRNGTAINPMRWYLNGRIGDPLGVVIRAADDLNGKTNAQWDDVPGEQFSSNVCRVVG